MTAATEMQSYLRHLQAKRALGTEDPEWLDEAIAAARDAYVTAAVTAIAMFRGELNGRLEG